MPHERLAATSSRGAAEDLEATAAGRARRRQELIDATITSIAVNGLPATTLSKVTKIAGLSPGLVSFYFASKDDLLLESLRYLAEEYYGAWAEAVRVAGDAPAAKLAAIAEACFAPDLCHPYKVAVWYAFWGEVGARRDYRAICDARDTAFFDAVLECCTAIIADGGYRRLDPRAMTYAFAGLIDGLWQDILFDPETFDADAARQTARAFLAGAFPQHFDRPGGQGATGQGAHPNGGTRPEAAQGFGDLPITLPAWTYDNAEFFALEREHLFLPHWHLVCHVSDVAEPGAYNTFDMMGERAFVIRGEDGELRAFHNVCRHRAHAVVAGRYGTCKRAIQCPYHGWSYGLDGRLKAVPGQTGFPGLDKAAFGLHALDLEVFQGFVYIRFKGEGPSVAERMAPYADELAQYRFADMRALGGIWRQEIAVDWKNIWDNYLEGYHFVTGHPGLYDLMGKAYDIETAPHGVARLSHGIRDKPARGWSTRHYQRLLPEVAHLSPAARRAWFYFPMYPGVSFDIFPEQMDYFQVLPAGPGRAILRGRMYALPDARREIRAARYLGLRLNRQVQVEDEDLLESVQRGLGSSSYSIGVLSEIETVVRHFQDWIRDAIPVAAEPEAPAPGSVAARNAELLAAR